MQPHSSGSDMEIQSDGYDSTARGSPEKKGFAGDLLKLPTGYYVEQDSDSLIIRRIDGSMVAALRNQRVAGGAGHTETFIGRGEPPALATSPAEPGLQIKFFGRFELLREGKLVVLGNNVRALAILKYLLARRAYPISRDYLMSWLWPESDSKRARWSLNSAIYALRKLLAGCLPTLSASETILFEGGEYWLSPHIPLSTDTDEFDSRYERGRRLEKAGRALEAVAEYEKAAELYRGDYLIEDLYEEWTVIERERLLDVYADLSRRLAIYYMKTGQPWESVRTCYQVLAKDRCDEDTHRLLMECFARLGQRSRALRQYELCEQVLKHEHNMAPSPETQALYIKITKDGVPR